MGGVPALLGVLATLVVLHRARAQTLDPRPADAGRTVVFFFGGAYRVSYIIDGTNVDVAVQVRTTGWAAFGIRK